jgi:hypothetical protein
LSEENQPPPPAEPAPPDPHAVALERMIAIADRIEGRVSRLDEKVDAFAETLTKRVNDAERKFEASAFASADDIATKALAGARDLPLPTISMPTPAPTIPTPFAGPIPMTVSLVVPPIDAQDKASIHAIQKAVALQPTAADLAAVQKTTAADLAAVQKTVDAQPTKEQVQRWGVYLGILLVISKILDLFPPHR